MPISIGQSFPRIDAHDKVTGAAKYPGDLVRPDMLHMKILFAGRPHARVLSIDTAAAEILPGLVAIYTSRDVPINEYGLQKKDQPVLCGPNPVSAHAAKTGKEVAADVVRFEGDQIAAIVAETEEIAGKARDLIKVEYSDLPAVFDATQGMEAKAPLIHPELGDSNVCVHYKIRKGNVSSAFSQAEVIVEGEYNTPWQEHAYLQPEAGIAYLDDEGRVTIECGGQWTHADRAGIAHSLGLPEEKVRVIYPAIGGAFGGREDLSVQIVLALAALKLERPVRIIWNRQESIIGHGKRHPIKLKAKWGASKEGKLLAAEIEMVADSGAYMYTTNKVLGNSTITCTGPYFIPNVKVDTYGVYTNNVPGAAFRGFGAPQALWMAELQMDKLAAELGLDPVEFRHRNALREGDTLGVGTPAPGRVSIVNCIEAAAKKAGWENAVGGWTIHKPKIKLPSNTKRGIGFAAGFKNVGFSFGYQENSWARIELHGKDKIDHAVLWHASAEVGQGTHTVMIQMAAESLGIPENKISLVTSDTINMGDPGSVSASRMTFMSGNAIRGAAALALEKWEALNRPAIAEYKYLAPKTQPFDPETGHSIPNFSYAYTAQAVELEVDLETGFVKVLRVVSANDVGKAINPALVEGQIEGGVVQAQGYAMLENMKMKNGHILTDQFSTYLIPTILDIPEKIDSVIIEVAEPNGPFGARGLGELPFLPLAPAIAAAVHDATGIWFSEFPLTPETILRGLGKIN
jgi:CO/xanthine dehydrogenase Mo-binding subunit